MIKRALVALVACLAVAALAAGCGGDDDTTSGGGDTSADSDSAPTKAAFIKEADGLCRAANDELEAEVESYAKENGISLEKQPSKAQQLELYEEVVLPRISEQGEELGELTRPAGDEEKVDEIIEALDEGVEEAEADPELLAEGKDPLGDASAKAKAYGMKVCGAE